MPAPKQIDYDDLTPQQIENEIRFLNRKLAAAQEAVKVATRRRDGHTAEITRAHQALVRKTTVQ